MGVRGQSVFPFVPVLCFIQGSRGAGTSWSNMEPVLKIKA